MKNLPINKKMLYVIYFLNFLLAFSIALPTYINSTFLEGFTSEKTVGLIYTIASFLTLIVIANYTSILRKFTNYTTIAFLLFSQIALLLGLITLQTFAFIAPIFILYLTAIPLIRFNLDVFLESYSSDEATGGIRGIFLTSANLAWVVAPAIAGFILTNGDYWKIYTVAAFLLIPILFITHLYLRKFQDPAYDRVPFWGTLKEIWRRKNVYRIFMANLLLWFFYAWMVIYMPIYLHQHLGFEWSQLGIMFTMMLLPFILVQLPAGRLADKKWGEKEFLTIGFVIIAISSGLLAFISSTSFWVWTVALFATRIGASLIEVMTESYFFKKIDSTDTHILGVFRNTRAIAYIVAPIMASVFLSFFEYRFLFLALGIIMLLGLRYSLTLKDTR